MKRARQHVAGCECELPACAEARAAAYAPPRARVLSRFETLLCLRSAAVQVSPTCARVDADGQTLILKLDLWVIRVLSAAGRLPPLEVGRPLTETYHRRVTGERSRTR